MKRIRIIMHGLAIAATMAATQPSNAATARETRILCTTFPLHQITRHVTQGRSGIKVERLLPASLGCPHHYSLTPQDMQKLARANVLVINGLGMEEFLGAPVEKANPSLTVIDSSKGIRDLLEYTNDRDIEPVTYESEEEHGHAHDHHDHHGDHRLEVNPHLFASPRQTARLVLNIAAGLSQQDPEGSPLYVRNATAYAAAMNELADEMAAQVKKLKNTRIVQPHGAFDYLARDIGLQIVAVTQPQGQEPSAAAMLKLIRTIRAKKAGAIFTEPQYSSKVGVTIARETGIPTAILNPAASGPDNAPLDYYETVMRKNMETLNATLGVNP